MQTTLVGFQGRGGARLGAGAAFLLAGIVSAAAWGEDSAAPFQKLINLVPRSANAVVILNVEKAMASPKALKENWNTKRDTAFRAGMTRVPPEAKRFVLASQIDFEFMQPQWEAALMDLDQDVTLADLIKTRGGAVDPIENLPAAALRNDTYLVQFGPRTLGAMGPANRQQVMRWIRDVAQSSPRSLSPYLERAALYSDDTGSEIIMALDLDGVLSRQRVAEYLSKHKDLVDSWGVDADKLAALLSGVQGVRLGIRIGEQPTARMVVDLRGDASLAANCAKPLLLQAMKDLGVAVPDFESWAGTAAGHEISLSGDLSDSGLQRLLSVVNSPAPERLAAKADAAKKNAEPPAAQAPPEPVSPGDAALVQAKATREYFHSVNRLFNDLKESLQSVVSITQNKYWFDKYANRIERLPMQDVDAAMLDYGAFVADSLRRAAGSVGTMGIRVGARQSQIDTSGSTGSWNNGYRYGAYGSYNAYGNYGNVGYQESYDEVRAAGVQRRAIQAQEKATMATDVQTLRSQIISATSKIRREMTDRYKIQF